LALPARRATDTAPVMGALITQTPTGAAAHRVAATPRSVRSRAGILQWRVEE
jgi:hypothetical protein